jgi:hypothetical protein
VLLAPTAVPALPLFPELGPLVLTPVVGAEGFPAGPRSTTTVLEVLARIGGLDQGRLARLMAPFPVAGPASYGEDAIVYAAPGSPVVAAADGTVVPMGVDPVSGTTGVRLTADNGTVYSYASLERLQPFLFDGSFVTQGEILGYVGGATPDGGKPRVIFEVRPNGAAPVPPAPLLDQWLAEALVRANLLLTGAPHRGATASSSTGDGVVAAVRPAANRTWATQAAAGSPMAVGVVLGGLGFAGSRLRNRLRRRRARPAAN